MRVVLVATLLGLLVSAIAPAAIAQTPAPGSQTVTKADLDAAIKEAADKQALKIDAALKELRLNLNNDIRKQVDKRIAEIIPPPPPPGGGATVSVRHIHHYHHHYYYYYPCCPLPWWDPWW
ncbi:MAG: hypothetical protein J2P54_00295 [Bradyrhizobiaceae bacterium]|nr:hypothetical protein [Bradyrhizobiaceae bacterium]